MIHVKGLARGLAHSKHTPCLSGETRGACQDGPGTPLAWVGGRRGKDTHLFPWGHLVVDFTSGEAAHTHGGD